jgi:hypothetical protein
MFSHFLLGLTLATGQVAGNGPADNWQSADVPKTAAMFGPVAPTPPPAAGQMVVSPEQLKALVDAGVEQRLRANSVPQTQTASAFPGGLWNLYNFEQPEKLPAPPQPAEPKNGDPQPAEPKKEEPKANDKIPPHPIFQDESSFVGRFLKAYYDEFTKNPYPCSGDNGNDPPPPERRALPEPWSSPPFPGHEYQGYPLMGVPRTAIDDYPLGKALVGVPMLGDFLVDNQIKIYGWATGSGNFSTSHQTNAPTSYWIVPNSFQLDQLVLRFEREADTVQTQHWDWGFRSTFMYGEDYRYTTAGGWMSDQLLKNNRLYGLDPIEQYVDVYVPRIYGDVDMVIRFGRWVACPDIETQLAPDNYMGSHSLLFTYDTYTQTGIMATFRLDDHNMVQAGITAGTDMAPWYPGGTPTGFFAWRWVSQDNNDAFYTVLNNINDAIFRRTYTDGQLTGHDNFNYIVSTWEHRFSDEVHTKTEAYFMWQRDAYTGGTGSIGNPQSFGGGGGTFIPGYSLDYGVLNYTMFKLSKQDYFTVRNEVWNDPQGERTGYQTLYSSHTIGISHNFNAYLQIRPEIGYYHSYDAAAFDFGTKHGMLMGGFDVTLRF